MSQSAVVANEIQLTDKAADQVRSIQDRESLTEHVLRISVTGGGCSGMSYRMGFVENSETGEHDQLFERNGVSVVVDPKSFLYLNGTTIDFTDGLNGKGFTFNNPNAQKTCGCGSSFSA
ncbi:MAG: iron-sulfur cluster insertion protein ErpA [Acidobacteriota bacterium]